jgi:hypothetical protein
MEITFGQNIGDCVIAPFNTGMSGIVRWFDSDAVYLSVVTFNAPASVYDCEKSALTLFSNLSSIGTMFGSEECGFDGWIHSGRK